jgi:outer membrane protein assembly factor BamB
MPRRSLFIAIALIAAFASTSFTQAADANREALWAAVRAKDSKAVEKAIADGADVNARNEYGVSALWLASEMGSSEIVEQLVKLGADVNCRDDIWYKTPLASAVMRRQLPLVKLLIGAGAKDTDAAFQSAAGAGNAEMMKAILELKPVSQDALDAALFALSSATTKNDEANAILLKAGAKPIPAASDEDRKALEKIAGAYESDGGQKIMITLKEPGLVFGGRWLRPTGKDQFSMLGADWASLRVQWKDGEVAQILLKRYTSEYAFFRFKEPVVTAPKAPVAGSVTSPANWPSFRGPDGTGVADGQNPPITFDVKKNENVRWKTEIPGLGHSCPVVWGDRIFLTTAISSGQPDQKIRVGNYGDVGSVDDMSSHTWQVLCLDRDSGNILWTQTAYEGKPKIKRHLKGSQANCTIATDGKHVVACFGSEGLYCYDFSGKQLWKRDLSTLDSSFALDQEYEWGFGNSPVLHDGLCILQCDLSHDSFIAAYSLSNGEKMWSTPRDEIPSWGSPVVWKNNLRTEIVTNAAQYARGYDPTTGAELWRLAKKSETTVTSPVLGKDLAFVSSGNRPIQPIFAIRPGAAGDISLLGDATTSDQVAWSTLRGGPYMPTPILYQDLFYTCSNSGILACYEAATGKEIYKQRIGGASYTASPVASDGRIYLTSEQGEVRVVKAGRDFELLAVNALNDYVMATPAISNGALIVRSQHFLWSLGAE